MADPFDYRILVTGSSGQLGWELQRTLAPLGKVVAMDQNRADLARPEQVREAVEEVRPQLIVNAAAYTAVDRAEEEPTRAHAINSTAAGVLAEEAKRWGAGLIHYSTDYVFGGTASRPYGEEDPTEPLGVYGQSKLEGEQAIRMVGPAHIILRTSWLYGVRGHNFLLTILRLARERDELRIVDDQVGAPTWSRMVAGATALIVAQCCGPNASRSLADVSGTYHLTAAGQTTWFGFAQAILRLVPFQGARPSRLVPIPTSDYPTPARRPMYSVLDNARLREAFGIQLPPWEDSLTQVVQDLRLSPS